MNLNVVFSPYLRKHVFNKITLSAYVIVLALLGVLFILYTWNLSINDTERNAISLAEAAEAGIMKSRLLELKADSSVIGKSEYEEIKSNLMAFTKLDNDIRFAYILIEKNNRIYFLADSEPADYKDYSPPGQEYYEASQVDFSLFERGETVLTKPTTDRWGEWISVLVPMKDRETSEVIAVFGVDYPVNSWYDYAIVSTIQAICLVLCIFIIIILFYFTRVQNNNLRKEQEKLVETDAKLRESEILFRAVFNQSTIGISIGNKNKIVISDLNRHSVNPMYEKITGRTKQELENMSWEEITHPDDLAEDLKYYSKLEAGEIDGYELEKRYLRPDGSEVWVRMTISPLRVENNSECSHLCIVEDISKYKELQKILYDSERSKTVLLDNLPGMAYRCDYDHEWTMQFVSGGCFELTGYKSESLLQNKDLSFNDLIKPKYQEYLWNKWASVLKESSKLKEEYEIITASGETKWVWEQGQGVYDMKGNVIALEGLVMDITERKTQEMKLNFLHNNNSLTGIYNKRYFMEKISDDILGNPEKAKAVILINLKKFSIINLTLGYTSAENLIMEFADSLQKLCCDKRHLFHISIDRFIFYIEEYKDKDELILFCENIVEMMCSAFSAKTMGGNIGVVEAENIKNDIDCIIKYASIAAENVSGNKIFGYSFFNKEMEEKIMRKAEIKSELMAALQENDDSNFYLSYQPFVDSKTNKIEGFEALSRFRSERLGNVTPDEFIPLSEESQLIVPLGKRVMQIAFRFLKQIEINGYDTITMAFNVSAIQLLRDDFLTDLTQIMNETGINPNNLCIEITESIFSNNFDEINEKLEKIKQHGIKIAIDDFGTGYSSLARERELNVNCLKIDKFFIDKLVSLDESEAITGDIISMAHKLGHYVIAEGVEYEKQRQYLIEHGCDLIQGYLISKPVSAKDAIELLNKSNI